VRILVLPLVLLALVCGVEGAVTSLFWNNSTGDYIVVGDAATTQILGVVRPGQSLAVTTSAGAFYQVRALADSAYQYGDTDSAGTYFRINPDGSITNAGSAALAASSAYPVGSPPGGTSNADPDLTDDQLQSFLNGFWFSVGLGFLCILAWYGRALGKSTPPL